MRGLLAVVTVVAVVFALRALAPVALPVAFALFLIGLLWPLQHWLGRRLPGKVAFVLTLAALCAGLWLSGWVLGECVDEIAEQWPRYDGRFRDVVERWRPVLEKAGVMRSGEGSGGGSFATRIAASLFHGAGAALLVIAFTALGLLEVQQVREKLAKSLGPAADERIVHSARRASARFGQYFATRTAIGAIQGVITGVFCALVGLDFALVWGVSSALLNYVPTIGSVLAVVPPGLFALLQFPEIQKAALIVGGLAAVQIVLGNYVDPRIQGRFLSLSPFVVLLSITFWGWLWGPAGALIGVPLTIGIAIVCEQFPGTRWIAVLLSDVGADEEKTPDA